MSDLVCILCMAIRGSYRESYLPATAHVDAGVGGGVQLRGIAILLGIGLQFLLVFHHQVLDVLHAGHQVLSK